MEFNQYNTTVQQWIHTVLENRETNADMVLECCRDIIAYGRDAVSFMVEKSIMN